MLRHTEKVMGTVRAADSLRAAGVHGGAERDCVLDPVLSFHIQITATESIGQGLVAHPAYLKDRARRLASSTSPAELAAA